MFIDTHTHLYSEQFNDDRTEMIQRAINAGVERMYLPNIDLDSIDGMHALENQFPENCFAMMGLHPCSVDQNWESVLGEIKKHINRREYAAIGEIGMDLYWDKFFIEEQKAAFRMQIEWAKELGWPIVIHARDSFAEIFEIMDEAYDERLSGIFHCFTGGEAEVNHILKYSNFSFGIGGVVTYKKSDLPEVLSLIPLNKLVLETDAPYLPPTPFRGKRNESSYLLHTAEKVAEILELPLAELGKVTTENALKLFKL